MAVDRPPRSAWDPCRGGRPRRGRAGGAAFAGGARAGPAGARREAAGPSLQRPDGLAAGHATVATNPDAAVDCARASGLRCPAVVAPPRLSFRLIRLGGGLRTSPKGERFMSARAKAITPLAVVIGFCPSSGRIVPELHLPLGHGAGRTRRRRPDRSSRELPPDPPDGLHLLGPLLRRRWRQRRLRQDLPATVFGSVAALVTMPLAFKTADAPDFWGIALWVGIFAFVLVMILIAGTGTTWRVRSRASRRSSSGGSRRASTATSRTAGAPTHSRGARRRRLPASAPSPVSSRRRGSGSGSTPGSRSSAASSSASSAPRSPRRSRRSPRRRRAGLAASRHRLPQCCRGPSGPRSRSARQ